MVSYTEKLESKIAKKILLFETFNKLVDLYGWFDAICIKI